MKKYDEKFSKPLLDILNKKYQIFFEMPKKLGEIEIAMVFHKQENELSAFNLSGSTYRFKFKH